MLKRSPKLKLKTFPPEVSVGVVISPPAAQLRWWKGRIVTAASFYRARRNVEYRKRIKPKGDKKVRIYPAPMQDSDVVALLYELGSGDQAITPREFREYREFGEVVDKAWIQMAGPVIAEAAVSAIKRKNKP